MTASVMASLVSEVTHATVGRPPFPPTGSLPSAPQWPGALCDRRLPGWESGNWWDTGDDGNRLAVLLCAACPIRARCADRLSPVGPVGPVGVVCAGVAYDDTGRPAPLCGCGRPAVIVRISKTDRADRTVTARVTGRGAGSCTLCVPPARPARPQRPRVQRRKHTVDGGAVDRLLAVGWPTDRRPTIAEKKAAVAALIRDGHTNAEIAELLRWPGRNPAVALKRWICRYQLTRDPGTYPVRSAGPHRNRRAA
jgi:hypothetical protein